MSHLQYKKVPKLRFPGFSDEWKKIKLVAIADFQEGPGILTVDFKESGTPLIRLKGLQRRIASIEGCNYLDEDKVAKKWSHFKLKKGDVLLSTSASLGTTSLVDESTEGAVAYTGIIRFRPLSTTTRLYLEHLLSSKAFIKQIKSMKTGATISHFGPVHLRQMTFFHPDVKEQEKIAGFLTAVNERIEHMENRLELSKKYKKGLVQRLFTQKGLSNPTHRFKKDDGSNFPDWKYNQGNTVFENVAERNNGRRLPILAITQDKGAVPRNQINYDISVTDASIDNYKVVNKGDFIISLRSFQGGIEYSEYDGICSPAYIILRPRIEIADGFYKDYLKTRVYIQNLTRKLEGIRDGKMISYKYFSEVELPYPDIKEQEKITVFLAIINQMIEKHERKLEQAKKFKKALLQQMFV